MRTFVRIATYSGFTLIFLSLIAILFFHRYYRLQCKLYDPPMKDTSWPVDLRNSFVSDSAEPLRLVPVPKHIKFIKGFHSIPKTVSFKSPVANKDWIQLKLERMLGRRTGYSNSGAYISFQPDNTLSPQAYKLLIAPDFISIQYGDLQGLHYALVSLRVLEHNYNNKIPCLQIKDEPDLSIRGVLIDISRDKIPSLESLHSLVRTLTDLKYNHLQLYIEGFSFAYPSFETYWKGKETPLTGNEIHILDSICRENYIELAPNHNTLGHMDSWLATPEYSHLAECPDGYKRLGLLPSRSTLDPSNPESLKLIEKITDDLLPAFSSSWFNINLDEPKELGKGKNRKLLKEKGLAEVYLAYCLQMHEMMARKGKRIMMWGDMIRKHPDLIPRLPKDIMILDWGYEADYPFAKNAETYKNSGISFMVCPGTSSWTSIAGQTDNMLANIENAVNSGKKNGAAGMLLTDWGDMGHWQYPPVSLAAYTVGAGLSWNTTSGEEMPLTRFMSHYFFGDTNVSLAQSLLQLGNYNKFEEFQMYYITSTFLAYHIGLYSNVISETVLDLIVQGNTELMGNITPETAAVLQNRYKTRKNYQYEDLNLFLDSIENIVRTSNCKVPDSAIIKREIINAIQMIRLGSDIKYFQLNSSNMEPTEEERLLTRMQYLCNTVAREHKELWLQRNKEGGLERSLSPLYKLEEQIVRKKRLLQKPQWMQSAYSYFEESATGALIYYLKHR